MNLICSIKCLHIYYGRCHNKRTSFITPREGGIIKLFLIGIILVLIQCAFAWGSPILEGRLLSVSSSGKTVFFNLGQTDTIKNMDYAVVLKKINSYQAEGIKLVPVAKARVVKIFPHRSVWVMFKIFDPTLLVPNDEFVILTETNLMQGRKDWDADRVKIVGEKDELTEAIKNHLSQEKETLTRKKEDYDKITNTHELDEDFEKNFKVTDIDQWENHKDSGGQGYKKSQSLYRSESKNDFLIRKRVETFDKLVVNYLQTVNRPGFNYEKFYRSQMKDPVFQQFREGINHQSEYFAFLESESKQKSNDAVLYRNLLDRGESWSEDFSDEDLSALLDKVGVVYEQERRRTVMSNRYNYQFHILGGVNFLDNQNRVDEVNSRSSRWMTDMGVRFLPFNQTETLQQLAFETSLKYSLDGVSLGDENARSTEYSAALMVVWYLFNSPYVIDKNSFFIATGIRTGYVQLAVPEPNNDQANYSLLSLPIIQAGLNYNFRSGYGLRFVLSMEKLGLTKINQNNDATTLPETQVLQEGKMALGLTKFF